MRILSRFYDCDVPYEHVILKVRRNGVAYELVALCLGTTTIQPLYSSEDKEEVLDAMEHINDMYCGGCRTVSLEPDEEKDSKLRRVL